MDEPWVVSDDTASALVHAHVAYVLGAAGVRALHIKGPSIALWLYEPGERAWGDVDVLVSPDEAQRALDALASAGSKDRFAGVGLRTSDDHAVTLLHHPSPDQRATEIDVHHRFEGLDADSRVVFEELWRRREPVTLAHTTAWFPDLATRALLVAVNAARTPHSSKARADLARLIGGSDHDDWLAVVALGRRVGALPALRAGLELHPEGAHMVEGTPLREVPVSPEWLLRAAEAPRTAVRLAQLTDMSRHGRLIAVVRWTFPPPAIIRMRDPSASPGLIPLLRGYAHRYRDAARTLGPSISAHRRARRTTSGPCS
jgi:hypothetical protein